MPLAERIDPVNLIFCFEADPALSAGVIEYVGRRRIKGMARLFPAISDQSWQLCHARILLVS